MLFSAQSSSDEAGLKVQFNRTKVCLQGITDEAAIQRTPDKMHELIYLQNAHELALLIHQLNIHRHYRWLFGQENKGEESGVAKKSDRRRQAEQVMEDYNQGNYTAPINASTAQTNEGVPMVSPMNDFKLQATDIILDPFQTPKEIEKDQKIQNFEDEKALYKRRCLNGFLSTPKFIAALTDICDALIPQTNRKAYLREQLLSLN